MKKYFISFNWVSSNNINGFSNCVKTSLNDFPSSNEIRKWEEEIRNDNKVKLINIMFFKEVK